jgi:hypothetical protein
VTPAVDVAAGDPLDAQMPLAVSSPPPSRFRRMYRAALGLSATRVPLFLMLAAGALLGPRGVAIIAPSTLDALQPIVPVALAGLGVLLGVGLDLRSWRDLRLLDAGSLEATITMMTIAAAYIVTAGSSAVTLPVMLAAVLVAVCGGPSTSHPASYSQSAAGMRAIRLIDFDDVVPVIVTAVAVTAGAEQLAVRDTVVLLLKASAAGAGLALAGRLLVGETDSDGERRVFIIAVLLLVAGVAGYLRVPSLFVGLVAGLVWGATDRGERLASNVRYLQHLILMTVLIIAGARVVPTAGALWLAGVFVLARTLGKLAGSWAASAAFKREIPRLAAVRGLSPGLVGIALALTIERAFPGTSAGGILLAAVVIGSFVSDLLSLAVTPGEYA